MTPLCYDKTLVMFVEALILLDNRNECKWRDDPAHSWRIARIFASLCRATRERAAGLSISMAAKRFQGFP